MQNVKDYWTGKSGRAKKAVEHTNKMSKEFEKEIEYSIENTKKYSEKSKFLPLLPKYTTEIVVEDLDSVAAILNEDSDNIAVLNFASYKNPGGAFLLGSSAQEESLCHESFLYNVLSTQHAYYAENDKAKNKALYLDRALYSPNIMFERNGNRKFCDVITCASPNLTAAKKYCNITDKQNTEALSSRVEFILNILAEQNKETIILGAFGCGVFGQSPVEVSLCFKDYLETKFKNVFKKVVFAVPNGMNGNLKAFKKTFSR